MSYRYWPSSLHLDHPKPLSGAQSHAGLIEQLQVTDIPADLKRPLKHRQVHKGLARPLHEVVNCVLDHLLA
ncbi:hypothetical protein MBAV_003784 [Candidatus Magnetobacterium bavaricum]|uniref:Uncharacterized protein n=1 Tax=Candidatus Magnetobacterium bavaricum TaxID=29290 RepID=A0A0F3GQ15_9BACT|nr:hypothetical protein MBAV_003784 [Candidatus Magnetobacterium bavaricum]